jgi:hypothetical protein
MLEFIIKGIDAKGKIYPMKHGFTFCLCDEVKAYQKNHPDVIRLMIDLALIPQTDAFRYNEGRFG